MTHDGADDLGALLQIPGDAGEQAAHPEQVERQTCDQ